MKIGANTAYRMTAKGSLRTGVCGRAALAVSLILAASSWTEAASVSAASASLADVSSAIALAADGDTVVVPPGTLSWTSTLAITKGITLQGAGNDTTVILDNVPIVNGNAYIVTATVTKNQTFRMTGITFRGSRTTVPNNGSIMMNGTAPGADGTGSVRIDHCHFDQLYTDVSLQISGWVYGVVDHCTFDIIQGPMARVSYGGWGNQPSGWGSWADPSYFGSEKFMFFEDNVVNNHTAAPNYGGIDADTGGRYVARHNTFNNCNLFYHGSDTGSGSAYKRGTRAVEIYNNTFTTSLPANSPGQDRSGPLVWHDNAYVGTYTGGMALKVYRLSLGGISVAAGGWMGAANGTSPWDYNATELDGTHVDGHAPYTYYTGKHTGGNDSLTVTVSGTAWTTNQWAGYSAVNTNSSSPYYGGCNYIVSNTSNTLILGQTPTTLPLPKFNTRDTFAIHRVLIVLDQPGRGRGDLIVGNPPGTTNLAGTAWPAWPHQALEPCYSWNNTLNGSNLDFTNDDSQNILRENVDYYNDTPMPGYTPYVYPHPLVSGVPAGPTNLRVIP
jgi:hypothetical protein